THPALEVDPDSARIAEDERDERQVEQQQGEQQEALVLAGQQPRPEEVAGADEVRAEHVAGVHGAQEIALLALDDQAADRAGVVHRELAAEKLPLVAARATLPEQRPEGLPQRGQLSRLSALTCHGRSPGRATLITVSKQPANVNRAAPD